MAIGSSAPCTDHEKRVWARERETISSLVMPGAALMPMILRSGRPSGPGPSLCDTLVAIRGEVITPHGSGPSSRSAGPAAGGPTGGHRTAVAIDIRPLGSGAGGCRCAAAARRMLRPFAAAGDPTAAAARAGGTAVVLGGCSHAPYRPRRAAAGNLDRRQGVDDPEARGLRPRGGQAGRPGDALPGAVLRPLLLPGAGEAVLQLHRADPGRSDHEADAGPRQADRHGPRGADVRGGLRPPGSTTTPPP